MTMGSWLAEQGAASTSDIHLLLSDGSSFAAAVDDGRVPRVPWLKLKQACAPSAPPGT